MPSHFADRSAAERALQLALPLIEPLMAVPEVCGSGFLYLVVMDPALGPAEARFEDAILLEHAVGDRARWDADYAAFAHGKARLAWRERHDGRDVQQQPWRLREGDSLLAGAVVLDGIVVAASGAHAQWDEAFATTLAACLKAVARDRHEQALKAGQLVAG
ncbi:hypothetical protein [Aquabacterium sp. J223]|uniref:hypothetical protein n=1 Tax=Aquabacterium sp. J223 TaxID=2898431 RepID=UPI0021AE00F9|nr:hypothetical protein [Aquabacterium sp. J223]UUX94187.1 hypothetical protein LRS07_12670 [Aquabacterium sp. J223]